MRPVGQGVALTRRMRGDTSAGGIGCATYDDCECSCPADTFQVDRGANGCW